MLRGFHLIPKVSLEDKMHKAFTFFRRPSYFPELMKI